MKEIVARINTQKLETLGLQGVVGHAGFEWCLDKPLVLPSLGINNPVGETQLAAYSLIWTVARGTKYYLVYLNEKWQKYDLVGGRVDYLFEGSLSGGFFSSVQREAGEEAIGEKILATEADTVPRFWLLNKQSNTFSPIFCPMSLVDGAGLFKMTWDELLGLDARGTTNRLLATLSIFKYNPNLLVAATSPVTEERIRRSYG